MSLSRLLSIVRARYETGGAQADRLMLRMAPTTKARLHELTPNRPPWLSPDLLVSLTGVPIKPDEELPHGVWQLTTIEGWLIEAGVLEEAVQGDSVRSLIARTLASHVDVLNLDSSLSCTCGNWLMLPGKATDTMRRQAAEHRLHQAGAILAALDGRLLPEGGQTREEWAYPVERDGQTVWIDTWIREDRHLGEGIWVHRRTVTSWPDGTALQTPWRRPVDESGEGR